MIGVWAVGLAVSLSAAIMFYRHLDDADSWWSAIMLVLGLDLALLSVIAFAGLMYIDLGGT